MPNTYHDHKCQNPKCEKTFQTRSKKKTYCSVDCYQVCKKRLVLHFGTPEQKQQEVIDNRYLDAGVGSRW